MSSDAVVCDGCFERVSGVYALLSVVQDFAVGHFFISDFREVERFPGAVDKFYGVRVAPSFLILTSGSAIVNINVQKTL